MKKYTNQQAKKLLAPDSDCTEEQAGELAILSIIDAISTKHNEERKYAFTFGDTSKKKMELFEKSARNEIANMKEKLGIDAFEDVYIFDEAAEAEIDKNIEEKHSNRIEPYFSIAGDLLEMNKRQGIKNGDFERNVWRMAYIFKSIQYSEEEERYKGKVSNPMYLLRNLSDNDLKKLIESFAIIVQLYRETNGTLGYLDLLQQKTQLADFDRIKNKMRLDISINDLMNDEIKAVEEYIKDDITNELGYDRHNLTGKPLNITEDEINKVMDEKMKRYKPLLIGTDLKKYELTPGQKKAVMNHYLTYSLGEIHKKKTNIIGAFAWGDIYDG